MGTADAEGHSARRVLHVLVGHGLPTYFLNAVRSIRATAPDDHLFIVDNASPDVELRSSLAEIAAEDDQVAVLLRTANDVQRNAKVGSLYTAYQHAFEHATSRGYSFVHLLQGDFQMLWWDDDVVARAVELFESHPRCVNIQTLLMSKDKMLTDELVESTTSGVAKLRTYGLTDTGLYHLGRWQALGLSFDENEQAHARRYLDDGLEVLCHPWPTDAPIPWPAVIRRGIRQGREVTTRHSYLLEPLTPDQVKQIKDSTAKTWLEDVCIPWGWLCLTPMWVTGLDSVGYWVLRYRDARAHGLSRILPRLEIRGITPRRSVWYRRHPLRPSLFRLFIMVPARGLGRRLVYPIITRVNAYSRNR
ncbi:MAG: hypothetical protein JWO62_3120 [Acidimicrobiaceae bacterium]|nr:hypothetical protein [Acidimicrobiaceae bacterium]